jgi:hypothetical protein
VASIEQIGTMAMTLLKRKPIVSITENTEQAQLVSAAYPILLDSLLEEYAWTFATERVQLQQLSTGPAFGYLYQFQMPPDLIMPLDLSGSEDEPTAGVVWPDGLWRDIDSFPWVVEGDLLLTNIPYVFLKYTYRVTETGLFSGMFTLALAHNIAATLAYPMTGNEKLSEELMKISAGLIAKAQARDAQKGTWQPPEQRDSWLKGRKMFRSRGWRQGPSE